MRPPQLRLFRVESESFHDEAMPKPLPPYLHHEFTRHKKPVWYFRRGKGKRIRISGEFGSVEFWAAYDAALNGARPARQGPTQGTFGWAMKQYRLSQAWLACRPPRSVSASTSSSTSRGRRGTPSSWIGRGRT